MNPEVSTILKTYQERLKEIKLFKSLYENDEGEKQLMELFKENKYN